MNKQWKLGRVIMTNLGMMAALFAALGLLLSGCGTGDGGNGSDTRPVDGLNKCTVLLEGHHYIGFALKGTSENAGLVKKAVLLALTEINEAGGIDGYPIGLVDCDTQGDPTVAADMVMELGGAAPISGIVGTGMSSTMMVAYAKAAAAKKPLISPAATSPEITDIEDDGYAFRTVVSDDFQGNILARIAVREDLRRVFVINIDNSWGTGLRGVFIDEFKTIWAAEGVGDAETSFASYDDAGFKAEDLIAAAQAWGPDAVLLIAFADRGAAVIKTAANQGWQPRWLLTDGVKGQSLVDKVGAPDALEGALGTAPAVPVGALYETFAAAFLETWGDAPFTFAAAGYDAAYLLATAMVFSVDPDNGEQVRNNLAKTTGGDHSFGPGEWATFLDAWDDGVNAVEYHGASGEVDFDQNGDVVSNIEEWAIRDGEIVTEGCWTPAGEPCNGQ